MANQKKAPKRRAPAKPSLQLTERGSKLLVLIREQVALASVDWDDTSVGDRAERRFHALSDRIERAGRSLMRRPVRTVADVADRALLSAWATPHGAEWARVDQEFHKCAIAAVLGMVGLSFRDCNADAACRA